MSIKSKILITGSAGFIGSTLYNFLTKNFKNKYQIYCTINEKNNKIKKIKEKKKYPKNFITINLTNKIKVKKLINKIQPNIIFHFASYVNHNSAEKEKEKCKIHTVKLTNNIIKFSNKKTLLFFTSTDKVYTENPMRSPETLNLKPLGYLAKQKLICEKNIINKFKKYYILRLPIVHCNGNYKYKNSSTIDMQLYKIRKKENIKVFSNIYRSFCNINDLCTLMTKLIKSDEFKYGIYNCGSKLYSYSKRIKKLVKKEKLNKKFIISIKGEIKPRVQNFNIKKLKRNIGFTFG